MTVKFPGIPTVIHGNGAVAEIMGHVCGGVIGYPITPSTEISELYEAFRAAGGCNVWGKHPFFFEPEGEHSAQSGALGASLTGGKYISNASSSQGILYGLESHYVTVGKKVGGFVLQVAARVVSRHSLNVMAGHDDVYALLQSGYTILFGSNPQEAADLAAISYKVSAMSLIPVANAMDGFATSHMMSEVQMPEPELLREFLGDPEGRLKAPTVAQEILFGAKGRVFQLKAWLARRKDDFTPEALAALGEYLEANGETDRGRQRRHAGRRDARLDPRGAARPVAPAVDQRARKGHAAAGAGARRREQPGPDRWRAEPAGLPGRFGRSPHALRGRGAAFRARGDGRIRRADRAQLQAGPDVHVRRRRDRGGGPRLRDRRRGGRRDVPAQAGQEGRRRLDQAAAAVPGGRTRPGTEGQEGGHGPRAFRDHGADWHS